jgi:hypothetical protein
MLQHESHSLGIFLPHICGHNANDVKFAWKQRKEFECSRVKRLGEHRQQHVNQAGFVDTKRLVNIGMRSTNERCEEMQTLTQDEEACKRFKPVAFIQNNQCKQESVQNGVNTMRQEA